MFSKKINIFYSTVILSLLAFCVPQMATAYNVSGVVDLSYRGYSTETGKNKSSYHAWTESFQTSLDGYFLDPRLMKFNAGVGYTVYTLSEGPGSRMLNYNVYTSFFPGMKVSWDLYGNNTVATYQSATNIAGYDISTTNYGGTLNIDLSRSGAKGNNNNNNNNNGMRSWRLPLPQIALTRQHSESEAISTVVPIHETRDDTKAKLTYRIRSSDSIDVEAGRSEYENLNLHSTYDEKFVNGQGKFAVTPFADFTMIGQALERNVENMTGFVGSGKTASFSAMLDFREKDGLRHFYQYTFSHQQSFPTESTSQLVVAQVQYAINKELRIRGGLNYGVTDFISAAVPPDKSKLETGGLLAGASYLRTYKPDFLGPFSFTTNYDFNTGFSKLTSETSPSTNGNGTYYSNSVNLGLASYGWKQDNLTFDYYFYSKRDHAPTGNDSTQQNLRAGASTIRIPRTTLRGTATYQVQDTQAGASNFQAIPQNNNQQHRSYTYDVKADYRVTAYLNLNAGAARLQTSSTTQIFTLAALAPDTSSVSGYDEVYYMELLFNYPITRNLLYRANARDEYHRSTKTDSENYQLGMNLDYRIRQIYLNLEYRFRQDIYQLSPRSIQQYYYAKISRPF